MPTKFRIDLKEPLKGTIAGQTLAVRAKRASGEYCSYPQFVEALGKEMPTAADELHHHMTGMSGEAGELLDASKKVWVYQKPIDIEHVIEELGDLRWYYQAALNMFGLTDEDIQASNTVKLMKRYPTGVYSNQQAIARADKAPPEVGSARNFIGMKAPVDSIEHVANVFKGNEVTQVTVIDMPAKAEVVVKSIHEQRLAALNALDHQK